MKGKLLFVAGLATGYVVGSRAGRSAYTTLTEKLRAARESDAVRSAVGKAKEVVQERAPKLTAAVSSAADTTASVAEAVSSAPDPETETPATDSSAPETQDSEAQEPAEEQKPSGGKRGGRGKAASTPSTPDSAEEAAKVFEEQLPETAGGADESATPTATS